MRVFLQCGLLMCSTLAFANPFNPLDVRSISMGNTGVASSQPGTAGLFNPALLSSYKNTSDFSMVLPNVGLSAYADPDTIDGIKNLDDDNNISTMTNVIANLNSAPASKDLRDLLVREINSLNKNLGDISGKPVNVAAGALFSFSVPSKIVGVSFYATKDVVLEAAPFASACDVKILRAYSNYVQSNDFATVAPAPVSCGENTFNLVGSGLQLLDPKNYLSSSVFMGMVTLDEVGLAFAHEFTINDHAYSFGLTPKMLSINSKVILPTVQNLDDFLYEVNDALDDNEKNYDDFNLDLGFASHFLMDDALTVGLVVKNLLAQSYKTAPIGSIAKSFDIEPQIRAGVAWVAPAGITLASDLDIVKNSPYFNGTDTQYLGMGAEWNIVDVFRVRLGMRTNINDFEDKQLSFGTGLNIVAVHFDMGGYFSDNNLGFAFQAGVEF